MKVLDVMTAAPKCCRPNMNLAAATELMWETDCGALPVVEDGKLAGMITDRDICIALGTRNRPAAEIDVKDVATSELQTCTTDDDVSDAMARMRRARVHRLPVVSDGGKLEGILSLNDLVLAAGRKPLEIEYDEVMNTIQAVDEHRISDSTRPAKSKLQTTSVAVAQVGTALA